MGHPPYLFAEDFFCHQAIVTLHIVGRYCVYWLENSRLGDVTCGDGLDLQCKKVILG